MKMIKFEIVIDKLEKKYSWLNKNENRNYYYNNNLIKNMNLSTKDLGILKYSNIKIKKY